MIRVSDDVVPNQQEADVRHVFAMKQSPQMQKGGHLDVDNPQAAFEGFSHRCKDRDIIKKEMGKEMFFPEEEGSKIRRAKACPSEVEILPN
jgi:hypothetical protein